MYFLAVTWNSVSTKTPKLPENFFKTLSFSSLDVALAQNFLPVRYSSDIPAAVST